MGKHGVGSPARSRARGSTINGKTSGSIPMRSRGRRVSTRACPSALHWSHHWASHWPKHWASALGLSTGPQHWASQHRTKPCTRNTTPAPGSCGKAGFGRRSAAYQAGEEAMFSHVMIGANDVDASKKFYDAVLGAIGIPAGNADPKGRIFYRTKTGVFAISKPIDGEAATHANGGTIGFTCDSPEKVRAFHEAGVANGGKS